METGAEMVERIRKKIQTEPFPVALTKMEWAQIIGVCQHAFDMGLTGQDIDSDTSSLLSLAEVSPF